MSIEVQNFTSRSIQDFHTDGSVKLFPSDSIGITNTLGDTFEVGDDGRVKISTEHILFHDGMEGSNINYMLWNNSLSAMTVTQVPGVMTLNANSTLTAGSYAIMISNKNFYRINEYPLYIQMFMQLIPVIGGVAEFGFGNFVGATPLVNDGVFVRVNAAGVAYIVQSFGGTEFLTPLMQYGTNIPFIFSPVPMVVNGLLPYYKIELTVKEDTIKIEIGQIGGNPVNANYLVSMVVPINSSRMAEMSVMHIPAAARVYNNTATLVACQLQLGAVNVQQMDWMCVRPFNEQMAVNQRGSYQAPLTPFAQTANHANSASPTAAVLSNTTPGYTTLGGRWSFAVVAGAVTDYILFGYQVPTGYDLIITDLRISSLVSVVLGATAVILDWSIGVNSTAATLAGTDTFPNTHDYRRLPVGTQGFIASAAVGINANDIVVHFSVPLVAQSGKFFSIIVQDSSGATGTLRGDVFINGFYE
jgi:hypothetical protein